MTFFAFLLFTCAAWISFTNARQTSNGFAHILWMGCGGIWSWASFDAAWRGMSPAFAGQDPRLWSTIAAVSIVGFAIGFVPGYLRARRRRIMGDLW